MIHSVRMVSLRPIGSNTQNTVAAAAKPAAISKRRHIPGGKPDIQCGAERQILTGQKSYLSFSLHNRLEAYI